jgi:hypothetical protein
MTDIHKLPTHVVGMISGWSIASIGILLFVASFIVPWAFVSLLLFEIGGFMAIAAIPFGFLFWVLFKLGAID